MGEAHLELGWEFPQLRQLRNLHAKQDLQTLKVMEPRTVSVVYFDYVRRNVKKKSRCEGQNTGALQIGLAWLFFFPIARVFGSVVVVITQTL